MSEAELKFWETVLLQDLQWRGNNRQGIKSAIELADAAVQARRDAIAAWAEKQPQHVASETIVGRVGGRG